MFEVGCSKHEDKLKYLEFSSADIKVWT